MSDHRYEAMLQECLAAYDNGLTPEECLSAFPQHRAALEPLFRQALALRIAYAAAPQEGFKQQLRDRVLFAAGREATEAYARDPNPDFVSGARDRLLHAAGAPAQEALRAVPPPRLPFWLNTRRRLLEQAGAARMRPSPRAGALVLQRGLSFAVLMIAMAVAGFAYLSAQGSPQSVNAQLASLEADLSTIEAMAAAGDAIPPAQIIDLSRRTSELAGRLDTESPQVAQKLPSIIERQREVFTLAVGEGQAPAQLLEVQEELTEAEAKVRVLAAQAEEQDVSPTPVQELFPPTATPGAPQTATSTPSSGPELDEDEVYIGPLPDDTMFGLDWNEVRTNTVRFMVPSSWRVIGLELTRNVGSLDGQLLRFDAPSLIVLVNVTTGEINALISGQAIQLRDEGEAGAIIDVQELLVLSNTLAPQLYHHATSLTFLEEAAGPATDVTTTPTATPPATATPSPTAAASPEPTATNTVVP